MIVWNKMLKIVMWVTIYINLFTDYLKNNFFVILFNIIFFGGMNMAIKISKLRKEYKQVNAF